MNKNRFYILYRYTRMVYILVYIGTIRDDVIYTCTYYVSLWWNMIFCKCV